MNIIASQNNVTGRKKGIVVSAKMAKTLVVAVSEFKTHSKYRKKYRSTKKYKVHDESGKYKEGDEIIIFPTRPISKDKFYKAI